MDPEQLARAADQADEALAAQTNDYALQAAIAERRPDLWAALASNPSSYPDLLVWLSKLSDPAVRAELEARGAVLQGTTVARADAESQDPEASREEDDSHGAARRSRERRRRLPTNRRRRGLRQRRCPRHRSPTSRTAGRVPNG